MKGTLFASTIVLAVLLPGCGVDSGCQPASLTVHETNVVYRISGPETNRYDKLLQAFRDCRDGDTILVYPGLYHECDLGLRMMMYGRRNLRIIGIENPVIVVEANSPGYQISMQFSHNRNLYIEGLHLRTVVHVSNNKLVYGPVFTASRNVLISNCVFQAEFYGTNTVSKNFVAVVNATNLTMRGGAIITLDITGSNNVSHCATHNAEPTRFENVTFIGHNVRFLSIGAVRLTNCLVAGDTELRQHQLKKPPPTEIRKKFISGTEYLFDKLFAE